MAIGRVLRQRREALQLALGLRLRGGRQLAASIFSRSSSTSRMPGVAVADLALDVAHAAAQQPLAVLRIDLVGARLAGERALRLGDRDLALEVRARCAPGAGSRRGSDEQRELLLGRQRQRRAIRSASSPALGMPATKLFHSSG